MSHLLQLPIWTDLVTAPREQPSPAVPLTLPKTISWQRMPEAMTITQIRLQFKGASAAEIKQGMLCGLEVQVEHQTGQETSHVQQAQQNGSQRVMPADWLLDASSNALTAELQLAVQYLEGIGISTLGMQYGPGDAVYLATWGSGEATHVETMKPHWFCHMGMLKQTPAWCS